MREEGRRLVGIGAQRQVHGLPEPHPAGPDHTPGRPLESQASVFHAPRASKSYELTGPELKDMHGFAEDYAAALGRQVRYVPDDVETWNKQYVDSSMAAYPHIE